MQKIALEENNFYEHKNHKIIYRTLTIRNLTKSDQGPYTCEVQGYSSNNETFFLHIHGWYNPYFFYILLLLLLFLYFLLFLGQNDVFLTVVSHEQSRELIRKAGEAKIKWVVNVTANPKPAITW